MCCFFMIWNLKTAITYKSGRVELSHVSVYFAISKFALLFSYSFHVPCIILYIVSMFPLLFIQSQSKAIVVNNSNSWNIVIVVSNSNIIVVSNSNNWKDTYLAE